MAASSLAKRLSKLEQQKARIAAEQAKIKTDERKARTRRLVEAGALVEKAGMLNLGANALLGALVSLADRSKDPARVAEWAKAGGQIFDREAKSRDARTEPLTVTFAAPPPANFSARLRAAGLRWNKVLNHWEGLAEYAAVAALAAEQYGAVRRLRPPSEWENSAAAQ